MAVTKPFTKYQSWPSCAASAVGKTQYFNDIHPSKYDFDNRRPVPKKYLTELIIS